MTPHLWITFTKGKQPKTFSWHDVNTQLDVDTGDMIRCVLLNDKQCILTQISLKFGPVSDKRELHYSDVIMSAMTSQITASRLFIQKFVQAQINENIKAPRHWPLWRESIGDRWIPLPKASSAENVSIWWRHQVSGNVGLGAEQATIHPLNQISPKSCKNKNAYMNI